MILVVGITGALAIITGISMLIWAYIQKQHLYQLTSEAILKAEVTKKEIDAERREALIRLKDELHKKRVEFDLEIKRERNEIDKLRSKINMRQHDIEKRDQAITAAKREIQIKEKALENSLLQAHQFEEKIKKLHNDLVAKLEQTASMSQSEARAELEKILKAEVRHDQERWMQKVEEEARNSAKQKATQILIDCMQRYTADIVTPNASGVVQLPNDDMKGRIIGKEGRNIKALEMSTGMEFVIGDTPEIITISGFNPVRREVARRSLEKLISDGRINPTRIEETVAQCEKEVDEIIYECGKNAIMELNLHGVKSEIVNLLGKLHFRTSYSQNVLSHSIEVAYLARMLAEELGLSRPDLAARAGLFHDMGKALSAENEGPHAQLGADVARRCGEDPIVVNAIAAHHEEVPFKTPYDIIVVIADTVSASRPGARRETLAAYIKRLQQLEDIAAGFVGVKKAYALQAGREIRVIVEENIISDQDSFSLARDLAQKIEETMSFPGQIKVNVIREKRAIEYAR